ncbi:MAG: hypothetical protein KGH54_00270 [Candidatus Micrarchaeota archaeon]|nr:hypothetical protein [Candidatus Micrarchaeota archaeon]
MLEGIVSCVKHAASLSENSYWVTSLSKDRPQVQELKSSIVLHLGDLVKGEAREGRIESAIISEDPNAVEECRSSAARYASSLILPLGKTGKGEMDTVTAKMRERLDSAASLFLQKLILGAPIVVRFHNDADGLTGAYGLYLSIMNVADKILAAGQPRIFWKMHRGVAYSNSDAKEDMLTVGNYDSNEKPLLLITDFGTTEESLMGAQTAGEKFDIIWLDHHPPIEELTRLVEFYTNPWSFGGNSNYTAGFLTCEFGRRFADIDLSLIQSASLIGDYSGYAQDDEKGRELALLLDMLTSDKKIAIASGSNDITPSEIDQILNDEKRRNELTKYAKARIEEAIDSGIEGIKQYRTADSNVYLLDFENVRKDAMTKYPLPGRYASKLLERIEKVSDKPPILLLHFGHFISIRVSAPLVERTNILKTIAELKLGYSYIEGAGGHNSAASIKLRSDQNKKELINALLRSLGCAIQ